MQFIGSIVGYNVLIFVDSSSSHSFVSTPMASSLPRHKLLASLMVLHVDDGNLLTCESELPNVEWEV